MWKCNSRPSFSYLPSKSFLELGAMSYELAPVVPLRMLGGSKAEVLLATNPRGHTQTKYINIKKNNLR